MQLIAFIIVYPLLWFVSILPFKLLYALSDVLYFFIYKIFGYRTKTVKQNLKLVFPEKTDAEIKAIMTKFYHHLCDMILEAIKSLNMSKAELKERFTFSNIEVITQIEAEQRSIVLMCGHYGSWEWIFMLQYYISSKGFAIYKQLANKYFDKLAKHIRAKHHTHLITTKEVFKVLADSQDNKELSLTGFASDQSPKANKAFHWQEFMGIKVPVHVGAEVIAKKYDMSVVFFGVKRIKRGFYETTFTKITDTPNNFKDYEITDQFLKLVEAQIIKRPEYYLWTHKRWKHMDKVPQEFI